MSYKQVLPVYICFHLNQIFKKQCNLLSKKELTEVRCAHQRGTTGYRFICGRHRGHIQHNWCQPTHRWTCRDLSALSLHNPFEYLTLLQDLLPPLAIHHNSVRCYKNLRKYPKLRFYRHGSKSNQAGYAHHVKIKYSSEAETVLTTSSTCCLHTHNCWYLLHQVATNSNCGCVLHMLGDSRTDFIFLDCTKYSWFEIFIA